jgi:hydrogenase maturation factor
MSYTNPGPSITTGDTKVLQGGPAQIGVNASAYVGFFGVTPTTQPTNAAQAALALTTATAGGWSFTTATAFNAFTAQLENIRASLVLLGLLKGS